MVNRMPKIKINVTSFRKILGELAGTDLYDGYLIYEEDGINVEDPIREGTKEGKTSPGLFKNLEGVTGSIVRLVLEEVKRKEYDSFEQENLRLEYDSDLSHDFGIRGYTDSSGSYIQRSLNDSEIEKLVRKIDDGLRPVIFGDLPIPE